MKIYNEVRHDFYDDMIGVYCIDAWATDDSNEEGKVVATFDPENGEVTYLDDDAKLDDGVINAINELKKENNLN